MMKVMTFEQYASQMGASRQDIGDSGLHKTSARISPAMRNKAVMAQSSRDGALIEMRNQLRQQFNTLVASGEIREPTNIEKLIEAANRQEDRVDTQAARRALIKRGIRWEQA
jgi:hypothetical protein